MGSIKNDEDQVVVTFEVERTLKENLLMLGGGKLHRSTNTTVADEIGWVLWRMLTKNMPKLDFSKLGPVQVSFDKEAGTFVATMKKQR
jgi:hypothetical protein